MGAPPFLYLKYNLFWRSIKENGLLEADKIISYDLSLHPSMAQITRMLKRAFDAHPDLRGLIFHSDQGGST